jgi:2-polyprenyl-3-methyl-5-hydroxy-6-metoxy-1,4-benzoquinol methylase
MRIQNEQARHFYNNVRLGKFMIQNILFDEEAVVEDYKTVRNKTESYNNLIEQPAMKLLLPDLKNKSVLDMGCGFGINCMDFLKRGAAKVTGIDISEKMLDVARAENSGVNIEYIKLGMERIDELESKFDFAYSSLAIHYVADFEKLVKDIYSKLSVNGILLFSQSHPLTTAPMEGATWIKNEQGVKMSSPVSHYLENGQRILTWKNTRYPIYHRSFSAIINALVENGFAIMKIVEPAPTNRALEIVPGMYDEIHRPTAIIIKAQKA